MYVLLSRSGEPDINDKNDEQERHDGPNDWKQSTAFSRLRDSINLRIVDDDERRLVEIAEFVGFRIDEEAFGAAFHNGLS